MPPQGTGTNALVSQVASLITRVEAVAEGLEKIEGRLNTTSSETQMFRTEYARCEAELRGRVEAAHVRIANIEESIRPRLDDLSKEIKTLVNSVSKLQSANRLLGWVSGVLGAAVIVWLLNQLLSLI